MSTVPAQWQPLYDTLSTQIATAEAYWAARAIRNPAPAFSAALLSANTNAGRRLLQPDAVAGSLVLLDALAALGLREVNIDIQLPFVLPAIGADYVGYRDFYTQLFAAIRARGMRASVELGTTFNDGGFSDVSYDYRTKSMQQYRDDLRAQAVWIATALAPSHLTLSNEPDTQRQNTGIAFTPALWADIMGSTAGAVRAAAPSVPLSAGTGTWLTAGYVDALLALPELDGIDLHLYPIANDWATAAIDAVAQRCRDAGKSLRFSEAWLYKASQAELGQNIASAADVFKRDVFAFWQPLDIRFLQLATRIARGSGAASFNFFWTTYLFGALGYDVTLNDLPYSELARRAVAAAAPNIAARTPNALGQALARIAAG
ncbi:MAG: hypothetical protein MUC68_06200 [Burkholderiaceae bacterium]|nr:hypothetical protein [Burkholderiaceae bacterium]